MTLQKYIREKLLIEEELPFEIKSESYEKGTRVLNIGDVEQNIYFVVSGRLESCMITPPTEKIIEFMFPGDLCSSTTSLLKQQPSDVYAVCLTHCEIQSVSFEQLIKACETSLAANKFYIHFLELTYLTRVQKEKDAFTKTTDQRYLELLKSRPHVIQEIPLGHIAKYLGVHPNSLSRIRNKLALIKK
jgi:CRP-like cAMP-binding protein